MSKVSGRVLDFEGKPAQGFRVQLGKIGWDAGLKLTDVPGSNEAAVGDDGRYTLLAPPGEDYLVVVSRPPAGTGPTSSSLLQYYYYPGVGSPDDAIRFDVRVGSELDGINITLNRTDRFRIRMTLPLPRYLPGVPEALTSYLSPGARIVDGFLHPLGRQAIRTNNYAIGLERQSDDVWLTPPIEPGDYELGLQYSTALSQALMSKKIGSLDWYALNPLATLRINVDPREDKDNDHILDIGVVPLAAKVSVAGRVIFKSGSDPKIDFTKLRFFFAGSFLGTHIVDPAADGTFEIKGVNPGLFEITPPPAQWDLPAGFYVASVTSGGDVLKDGLVIETDKRNPVEIVIADNASTVEGVVRGRNNSVVPDARVILIPPPNRRGIMTNFPVALSNESGEFVIDRVPPGDYRLLALDLAGIPDTGAFGVVTPTWQGADFLREFESRGERITLVPGARLVTQPSAVALHK